MKTISIIIPVGHQITGLEKVRTTLRQTAASIEVILVVSPALQLKVRRKSPMEQIVVASEVGRGHALLLGLRYATGNIILFLHADTCLPDTWHDHVWKTMSDKRIAGGGFSLVFDNTSKYLKMLVLLSDIFFWFTRELWGDRALFVRATIVKERAHLLKVPIMEDVRLSNLMRNSGKVVKLSTQVVTSAKAFTHHGILRHTLRILICRVWYALGGDPDRIYRYYYPKDV